MLTKPILEVVIVVVDGRYCSPITRRKTLSLHVPSSLKGYRGMFVSSVDFSFSLFELGREKRAEIITSLTAS
jgi:hypothetical protein